MSVVCSLAGFGCSGGSWSDRAGLRVVLLEWEARGCYPAVGMAGVAR
jgi:hypothetical protein